MEKAGSSMNKHAGKCAKEAGLDFDLISSCVNDPVKSMALQRKYADLTPSDHKCMPIRGSSPRLADDRLDLLLTRPRRVPGTDTPWVVVDGKLSKSDGDKLLEEVCAAYQGTAPPGCDAVLRRSKERCYAD